VERLPTEQLLKEISPKVVFSGDDHDQCTYVHPGGIKEFTLGTFSWLQGNYRPSFGLLSGLKDAEGNFDYGFSVCFLPNQIFLISWYGVCLVVTLVCLFRISRSPPVSLPRFSPAGSSAWEDDDGAKKIRTPPPRESHWRQGFALVIQLIALYLFIQAWYYLG